MSAPAALRGATWMAGAFAASRAIEIVPAGALMFATWAGQPASALVTMSASLALASALAQMSIYGFALRGLARGAPRVPWVAVILIAILAVVSYPFSTAVHYGITSLLAHQGSEALAEYAMGSAYVSVAAGLAHVVITTGALIAAAVMWSRAANDLGDPRAAG